MAKEINKINIGNLPLSKKGKPILASTINAPPITLSKIGSTKPPSQTTQPALGKVKVKIDPLFSLSDSAVIVPL